MTTVLSLLSLSTFEADPSPSPRKAFPILDKESFNREASMELTELLLVTIGFNPRARAIQATSAAQDSQ